MIDVRGPQRLWKVILVSVLLQLWLASQQASALLQNTVRGSVTDLEGNPLPAVSCVLTQLEQNIRISVQSGESGRFIRSGIPSGQYRVACELTGYAHEPTVIRVGSQAQSTIEIRMAKMESPHYKDGFQAYSDGRFEEAMAAMELVLADDPDDTRAEYILGLCLAEVGKFDEALQHLIHVTKDSESELAASEMVNLAIGRTYFLMGEEQTAEEYLQKVDDRSRVSSMFADAGTRAFNAGLLENAELYYRRALQENPHDPDALYGLGLCHLRAGQTAEALDVFRTLVSTSPEHTKAQLAAELMKELEAKR